MASHFNIQKSYRVPLFFAIFLHIFLLALMLIHVSKKEFRWESEPTETPAIVNATAVDARELQQHIQAVQNEQTSQERQRKQQLARLEQARQAEQARIEKLRHEQETLKQQQAEASLELKKQQQEAKAAEAKAKKIEAALALQKKEVAQRALAKEQEKLQKQLLTQQLQAEAKKLQAQQAATQRVAAANRGVLDQYRAQILRAIQQHWHPLVQDAQLTCQMLVHVSPGGVVTRVEVVKTSGDTALDRSAEMAILKASPLPVPKEAELFNEFREFRIKMTPEDIRGLG